MKPAKTMARMELERLWATTPRPVRMPKRKPVDEMLTRADVEISETRAGRMRRGWA